MQGATPGSVPNLTAAMEEYQLAADSGHAEAMARMGVLKVQGYDGHSPDVQAGIPLVNAAADRGSPSAYNALGFLYLQVSQTPGTLAFSFSQSVARLLCITMRSGTLTRAIHPLVRCSFKGEGVPVNDSKAFEMFLKASDAVGEYYGEDGAELDSEVRPAAVLCPPNFSDGYPLAFD